VHCGVLLEVNSVSSAFLHEVQTTLSFEPWIHTDQYTEFSGGMLIH